MTSQLTAYISLICTSGVLNLYLGFYVFAKRQHYTNISNFFLIYISSIIIYCFGSAFGLTATNLEQIKFWTIIQYIGMPISSPLGLLFIMKYLGIKITYQRCIALLFIPITTFIMVATNDFHQLHYRVFEVDPILGTPYIQQEIGFWYAIHGVFTFACMFFAFLLIISRWKETSKVYKPQLIALMFGQLVPMLTAFIYLLGLTPPGIDPVPMILWLSSLLYLWSINSSRLFTLMPIAKDTIFNSINDCVIVLDESNRLIEFNNVCEKMFPQIKKSMYGLDFNKVWSQLSGHSFPANLEEKTHTLEIELVTENTTRVYQVRVSALHHDQNKGLLIIFTDITKLKSLQLKLEHLAYYDELTQIYNRRAFFEKCEQHLQEAKIVSAPFTIILIDIDYFKKVNDTYGHNVGDQMLMHVVKCCQSKLNEKVLFARYGGEEFVLALKDSTSIEGEALANQLRMHIETHPLITKERIIPVTLSGGVAESTNEKEETLYQILNNADKALYSAKREGRNQVQSYKEEMIF